MDMKVLVVVDMQNDFTSGVLGNKECNNAVSNVVSLVNSKEYNKVILTRDTHDGDTYLSTQEGKKLPVPHCIKGTEGWQIRREIMEAVEKNYSEKDYVIIDKPTFGSKELAESLEYIFKKQQEKLEIHFCGVCTGICVISNVALIKAFLPESKVCVVESACACITPESHRTAIEAMKTFQVEIV